MSVAPLRSTPCAEEAQYHLFILALQLWEQGLTFVLNATGSAQPQACIVDFAFSWTFRWDYKE